MVIPFTLRATLQRGVEGRHVGAVRTCILRTRAPLAALMFEGGPDVVLMDPAALRRGDCVTLPAALLRQVRA